MEHEDSLLSARDQIKVLLDEHRVLYSLLEWRLSAADRRVLAAVGLLAASLTAIQVFGEDVARILLWALPVWLWVMAVVTVGHCRSKEAVLGRIIEIERQVNALAGAELLSFQTRHPGRGVFPAGRTGRAAIDAMVVVCVSLLVACSFLYRTLPDDSLWGTRAYACYAVFWGAVILWSSLGPHEHRSKPAMVPRGPADRSKSRDGESHS